MPIEKCRHTLILLVSQIRNEARLWTSKKIKALSILALER
jgi:hypothetical protein